MGIKDLIQDKKRLLSKPEYNRWLRQAASGSLARLVLVMSLVGLNSYGCARLSIVTTPAEADVLIQNAEKGIGKKLGKTPYSISMRELETYTRDGPAVITISKSGYEKATYVIPYYSFADLTISSTLIQVGLNSSGQWESLNKAVRIILLAYQSIFRNEPESAKSLVEGLEQEYPGLAAPWLIKALASLQEGNKAAARGFLERARDADPGDKNLSDLLNSLNDL